MLFQIKRSILKCVSELLDFFSLCILCGVYVVCIIIWKLALPGWLFIYFFPPQCIHTANNRKIENKIEITAAGDAINVTAPLPHLPAKNSSSIFFKFFLCHFSFSSTTLRILLTSASVMNSFCLAIFSTSEN